MRVKKSNHVDDLVSLLLNRVASKNLKSLGFFIQIFNDTIYKPIELDENLAKFSIKIGNSPSLMFEEDIQKEMQSYIIKRFEADQKYSKTKNRRYSKTCNTYGKIL